MTHASTIRKLFALEHGLRPRPPMPVGLADRVRPAAGQITLITGPSGGGKSSLLAEMRRGPIDHQTIWIEPSHIRLPNACVIDCICQFLGDDQLAVERSLELLGRVGLAEAWTYLQKPAELSDGQRWRLMLAMAVAAAQQSTAARVTAIIAMDEFAALLDRITARVVARALRRLIRPVDPGSAEEGGAAGGSQMTSLPRAALAAVVATSHDDLTDALSPDKIVLCDFDRYTVSAGRGAASDGRGAGTPSTP